MNNSTFLFWRYQDTRHSGGSKSNNHRKGKVVPLWVTPHSSLMLGVRFGVLSWKTGCLVSRCSGEPVFSAPSLLPTAPWRLLCFSPFSVPVPSHLLLSLSVLGWWVGFQTFSGDSAHRQARANGSFRGLSIGAKNERFEGPESVPAGSWKLNFFAPSRAPHLSLCSRREVIYPSDKVN